MPSFSYQKCDFHVQASKKGTGRVVVWRALGVENSYTFEASLAGSSGEDHSSAKGGRGGRGQGGASQGGYGGEAREKTRATLAGEGLALHTKPLLNRFLQRGTEKEKAGGVSGSSGSSAAGFGFHYSQADLEEIGASVCMALHQWGELTGHIAGPAPLASVDEYLASMNINLSDEGEAEEDSDGGSDDEPTVDSEDFRALQSQWSRMVRINESPEAPCKAAPPVRKTTKRVVKRAGTSLKKSALPKGDDKGKLGDLGLYLEPDAPPTVAPGPRSRRTSFNKPPTPEPMSREPQRYPPRALHEPRSIVPKFSRRNSRHENIAMRSPQASSWSYPLQQPSDSPPR